MIWFNGIKKGYLTFLCLHNHTILFIPSSIYTSFITPRKNDPFFIRTWVPRRVAAFVHEKNGTESCRYICVVYHYLHNYDLCSSEATFGHGHRCILPLECAVTLIHFYRSHHILFSLNMRFIFSMSMGSFVPWGKKHYRNLIWPTSTMLSEVWMS